MAGPRKRAGPPGGPLRDLGEMAAARRRLLGMTQRDAAELAGVGISSVAALEDGSDRLTLSVVLRIFEALGLALAAAPIQTVRADPALVQLSAGAPW